MNKLIRRLTGKRRKVKSYSWLYGTRRSVALFATGLVLVLSSFAVFLNPQPASAAISQVQSPQTGTCSGSGSCNAVSGSITAATANNLLVAVCSGRSQSGATTFTVSGFTSAQSVSQNGNTSVEIFYKVAAGGETSATCAATGTNDTRAAISLSEYSGTATTSPVDVAGNSTGNGTNISTTSINNSHHAVLLIAGFGQPGGSQTASSWQNSFTEQSDHGITGGASIRQFTADRIVNGASSYSTSATSGNSNGWASQIVAFKDDGTTPRVYSQITQEGYIWENDDGSAVDTNTQLAGSEFSSNKNLTNVRKGQRLTLRTHLSNTGTGEVSPQTEFGLFYDRGDDIWSRVMPPAPPTTAAGSGCGAGASADWTCTQVFNGSVDLDARYTDSATNPATGKAGFVFTMDDGTGDDALVYAELIGNGLGNCDSVGEAGGSSDWSCDVVYEGDNGFDGANGSLAFHSDGTPWVSFRDNSGARGLYVAEYVGGGNGDCDTAAGADTGSADWDCTYVFDSVDSQTATDNDIVIDSDGVPWVYFYKEETATTDSKAIVAHYVGGAAGDCDTVGDVSGSDDWICEQVFDGDSEDDGSPGEIAIDTQGDIRIFFREEDNTNGADIYMANYLGAGDGTGDCDTLGGAGGSDDWDCEVIFDGNSGTDGSEELAFEIAPDGNPWFVLRDDSGSDDIIVGEYVGGAAGDCDTVGGGGGSDDWDCTVVFDGGADTGKEIGLAFSPDGTPWVQFHEENATDGKLYTAHFVGGAAGDCDTVGGVGGSDDWVCTEIYDGVNDFDGRYGDITIDGTGQPWLSFFVDVTNDGQFWVATADRGAEITLSPGRAGAIGDSLAESHADMTSATNTANRDDSDCLVSGTWNNGLWSYGPSISGVDLPAGDTTTQCTELAWTIDTSQAQIGQNYRFVIASLDSFSADKGPWRGPISVATDGYPELTIADDVDNTLHISKDVIRNNAPDCDDTNWVCETLTSDSNQTGTDTDLGFTPDGRPFIFEYDNAPAERDFAIVEYVGSGGTGCVTARWNCEDVEWSGQDGSHNEVFIGPDGEIWAAGDKNGFGIVRHVGGGTGDCDNTDWECTSVHTDKNYFGFGAAIDLYGNPVIAYVESTTDTINVARYVGKNGSGCDAGVTDWSCELVDDLSELQNGEIGIAVDNEGTIWLAYHEAGTEDDVMIAQYVGSGGTGCESEAWNCKDLRTSTSSSSRLKMTVDGDGDPWVVFDRGSGNGVNVAEYVGTGGTGCATGVTDWTCTLVESGSMTSPNIATDSEGNPWIVWDDATGNDIDVAQYVGGGNGSGCTSSDWTCHAVDTSETLDVDDPVIAFDRNGIPWIAYRITEVASSDYEVAIARMKEPPHNQTFDSLVRSSSDNAGTSFLGYSLDSGLSPYTDAWGDCSSTADATGYCGLYHPEGHVDELVAQIDESPMYRFSSRYDNNNELPTALIHYTTDRAPNTAGSEADVTLQIYRYGTTNAWEDITTDSTSSSCTENCTIEGTGSGTASEYFETDGSNYWVHFRVIQEYSPTASITFGLDSYKATQPVNFLRHGRIFNEELNVPFIW